MPGPPAGPGQAHTHRNLARAYGRLQRYADTDSQLRQALRLYEQTGDLIGAAHAQLGDHDQALSHCQHALALLQMLDDRFGQAVTWDSLGYIHQHRDDLPQAVTSYQHAIEIFSEVGDRLNEATTRNRLGDSFQAAGKLDEARCEWRQAVAIFEELGHPNPVKVQAKID